MEGVVLRKCHTLRAPQAFVMCRSRGEDESVECLSHDMRNTTLLLQQRVFAKCLCVPWELQACSEEAEGLLCMQFLC